METRKLFICIAVGVLVVILAIAIAVPLAKRSNPGSTEMEKALRWMSETPLIDGHNDLAWFLKTNHDMRLQDIDLSQNISQMYDDSDINHTDIPRLRAGKVGAQFWSAYSDCSSQYKDAVTHVLDMIDVIKRMCKAYPEDFEFVTSADGIVSAFEAGKIAGLIGVEGGHGMDSFPSVMRMFAELGVRYMTMVHNCNTPWADNWKTDDPGPDGDVEEFGGLTEWGRKLVHEMNRLGVFVDMSHFSVASQKDALNESLAPVIHSHSSAFSLCHHHRNVRDEILPLMKENGGVIMVNFYTQYINCPPNHISENPQEAELTQVADHIEYLAEHCGHDHVGLGSDYDGGDRLPRDLEDVSKFPNLIVELIRRGWSEVNIKKLIGENLLRAMRQMEKVRDSLADEPPLEDNMPRNSGGEATNECRTYYYEPPKV